MSVNLFFLIDVFFNLSGGSHNLTVQVNGLQSDNGQVYIGVCNEKAKFLRSFEYGSIVKVKHRKVQVVFKNLPEGVYAISVFHDLNNNGQLDTNFLGMPNEPYGFSNNVKKIFGAPKFDDVKFTLTKDYTALIEVD